MSQSPPAAPRPRPSSPPAPGAAPRAVRTAATLVRVQAGLVVLGALALLVGPVAAGVGEATVDEQGLADPRTTTDLLVLVVVLAGPLVLAVCALYAVMARQLGGGRTWPRTVLVVTVSLSGVDLVVALGQAVLRATIGEDVLAPVPVQPVSLVLRVLGTGVQAAALVLLFGAPARRWLGAWAAVRAHARRRGS